MSDNDNTKLKLYKQVFDKIDKDGNGYVDINEFYLAMNSYGIPFKSNQQYTHLFEEIDTQKDQKICFNEFCEFIDKRTLEFQKAFQDITSTKYVTAKNIRKILKQLDLNASDEQIRNFLQRVDHNADGRVTFEDFQLFFALMPYPVNSVAIFEQFQHYKIIDLGAEEYANPIDFQEDIEGDKYSIPIQEVINKLCFGAVSGAISRTVTAPIDRLKLILQTQRVRRAIKLVFLNILKEDGYKGLFKGNGVNCLKVAPETAIKFLAFDFLKRKISSDPENVTGFERFLAGGLAGGIAQICIYPLEIAKTRFALSTTGTYTGLLDCVNKIYSEKGMRSLYSGLMPSVLGIFPYAGIDLSINSLLKEMASKYLEKKQQEPGVGVMLFCGMVSSSIGMMCTAPLNIVRTRMQGNGLLPQDQQYKGAVDCFQKIIKNEGILGFYKGMLPAMMKVLPATSISYTIFGMLNKTFGQTSF